MKNVKVYLAALGLATALSACNTDAKLVKPEEKISFDNDDFIDANNWSQNIDIIKNAGESIDESVITEIQKKNTQKREFGKDEFINANNWSQDLDIVSNAGLTIDESVVSEVEVKTRRK